MVPDSLNFIRQDILADFLFFRYNLSVAEFSAAKKLSVARNRNVCDPNSAEEHEKWPARPDIFLKCPDVPLNAVSMDEMADYFRYEKFKSDISEIEGDNDHHSARDMMLPETTQGVSGSRFDGIPRSAVNNSSIALLRDMYLAMTKEFSWKDGEDLACYKYDIGRSKLHSCRAAIRSLVRNEIDGVTCEDFEQTFEDVSVMSMPLRKEKDASILQAIDMFQRATS